MTSSFSASIIYEGQDTAAVALNYLTLTLSLIYFLPVCLLAPVSSNSKILERLVWLPLLLILFGLQEAFYYAVGEIGVSFVWAGVFGFTSRQMYFYWPWIRIHKSLLYTIFLAWSFAIITFIYNAVALSNHSSLYLSVVAFVIGLIIAHLVYWHVKNKSHWDGAIELFFLQTEVEKLRTRLVATQLLAEREVSRRLMLERQLQSICTQNQNTEAGRRPDTVISTPTASTGTGSRLFEGLFLAAAGEEEKEESTPKLTNSNHLNELTTINIL